MRRVAVVWIAGLVLLVPYAVYRLLFVAEPDEYAFLIVFPLFWIFGYWGVVGPLLAAAKADRLIRALETARDSDVLRRAFDDNEGDEVVVDLIATENRIPRWLARRIYVRVKPRLVELAAERRPDDRLSEGTSEPRGGATPERR
jgi:hypothetical protein